MQSTDTTAPAGGADTRREGLRCGDPYADCAMLTVLTMPVCEKRSVFKAMRETPVNADFLLPRYGITAGQFALMQVLSEGNRSAA
jgi:hypothetical protein